MSCGIVRDGNLPKKNPSGKSDYSFRYRRVVSSVKDIQMCNGRGKLLLCENHVTLVRVRKNLYQYSRIYSTLHTIIIISLELQS